MTKFKRGDRVLYRGAFNELLEESTAKVLAVNRENGLLFIKVEFPVESESGNSCDQWVHPCQCRKLKLNKKRLSKD